MSESISVRDLGKRDEEKESFVASQTGRFCQADANADCGSVHVFVFVCI